MPASNVGGPTDEVLVSALREVIAVADQSTVTSKQIRMTLQRRFAVDLSARKAFLKRHIAAIVAEEAEEEEEEEVVVGADVKEEEEEEQQQKKKKKKKGHGNDVQLSQALSDFMGGVVVTTRGEITKRLWAYIREHNLQNPDDKRQILLDDALQAVFKTKKFTMFTMNRFISKHAKKVADLHYHAEPEPSEEEEEGEKTSSSKKRKTPSSSSSPPPPKKKKKSKSSKKKAGAKASSESGGEKKAAPRKQPLQYLSPALALVVGGNVMSRPQVVKQLWVYIRANGLQNPDDKRQIICDDKLRAVFAQDSVTMFSMNKFVGPNFLGRAPYPDEEKVKEEEEA